MQRTICTVPPRLHISADSVLNRRWSVSESCHSERALPVPGESIISPTVWFHLPLQRKISRDHIHELQIANNNGEIITNAYLFTFSSARSSRFPCDYHRLITAPFRAGQLCLLLQDKMVHPICHLFDQMMPLEESQQGAHFSNSSWC